MYPGGRGESSDFRMSQACIFFFPLFLLGTGVSSLKHSKRTEMQDKKPVDKAAWASVAWGESRESAAQGKLRSKQGSSASGSTECAPQGRRFKPSSRGLVPSERAGSPPANKNARDCHLRNLSLERQVMEQPATRHAQGTPPQEPLPDGDGKRKRKAGIDLNIRKAPVSQSVPEARAESVVWSPSPGREDGASGAEQPEARAPASSGTESLSTTSEDVIFSVAMEAQVFMDSSHLQSEGEEAFSFDLQTIKLKMESVQDIPAVCRERSPANILRAFTASISGPASARAEGGISAERLTPRSLSWVLRKPRAGEASSDPESPSEEESGSKQQLLPRGSLQSSGKPHDDQDVFTGSESSARELSSPERQLAARYSSGAFGNTEAEEASSDPESALEEEESGSEPQRAPSHPFQPLEEPDDDQEVSDSESSSNSSGSDELLTPTSAAQTLGEPEDQMSTESDGYMEKYDSAEEWSSADEVEPPGPPSQASEKPADQQQVASVSQILPAEWGVSVERLALSFSKPILPQQMSKGSARPPVPQQQPCGALAHPAAGTAPAEPSGRATDLRGPRQRGCPVGHSSGAYACQNLFQAPREALGGATSLQEFRNFYRCRALFRGAAATAASEAAFPPAAGTHHRASVPGACVGPGCRAEHLRGAAASPTSLPAGPEASRGAAGVPGSRKCWG